MPDLDKVVKGLEKCLNPNLNCYHNNIDCPYESGCWLSDSFPTRPLKEDALELLKQYSGLAKALEQSNAVNEHLSAEIERLKAQPDHGWIEKCDGRAAQSLSR